MKIITKGGICSTKNKPMGFQFANINGHIALGGCFNATGDKVTVTGDDLPSSLYISDNYRGCRYCGNKYACICPSCGAVICNNGNGGNITCPVCGSGLKVDKASGDILPKATLVKSAMPTINVTSAGYDDIGKILDSLNIDYSPFKKKKFDCNLLFINCGTGDDINCADLQQFVKNGGCVYASDLTYSVIMTAFPGLFDFTTLPRDEIGEGVECRMNAKVVDSELRNYVGNTIDIEFDLGGWAVLRKSQGTTLLQGATATSTDDGSVINDYVGLPIMVKVQYGNGTIFYTCFHNHAQASEKEQALLQLLVLKQLGSSSKRSIEEIGAQMGINVGKIKSKFQ